MKVLRLGLSLLVLFAAASVHAETVSLSQYLDLLQQRHPFFVKEKLSVDVEKKQHERFRGAEDWQHKAFGRYAYREPIQTNFDTPNSLHGPSVGTSLERTIWKTGGRASLSWDYSFRDVDPQILSLGPNASFPATRTDLYTSGVFAGFTQPLLQNFGGILDRLEYELSGYTVDITKMRTDEAQEGFLLAHSLQFLHWTLLSEQKRITNNRLQLAREEQAQIKRKRAANVVKEVDLIRAEDSVRVAKQNVTLIGSELQATRAALAVTANSPELREKTPVLDLYQVEILPPYSEALAQLKEHSRLIRMLQVGKQQLQHQRHGLVEKRKAQLNLDLRAGLRSDEENFDDSFSVNQPDASASLLYSYPIGNRTARTDLSKSEIEIRRIDEDIKNISIQLESSLQDLMIQLRELERVLVLNREQIASARRKTKEELDLYNQGRSELTFVIQSRDNQQDAQLIYARNGFRYRTLHLQYLQLTDQLLPDNTEESAERNKKTP